MSSEPPYIPYIDGVAPYFDLRQILRLAEPEVKLFWLLSTINNVVIKYSEDPYMIRRKLDRLFGELAGHLDDVPAAFSIFHAWEQLSKNRKMWTQKKKYYGRLLVGEPVRAYNALPILVASTNREEEPEIVAYLGGVPPEVLREILTHDQNIGAVRNAIEELLGRSREQFQPAEFGELQPKRLRSLVSTGIGSLGSSHPSFWWVQEYGFADSEDEFREQVKKVIEEVLNNVSQAPASQAQLDAFAPVVLEAFKYAIRFLSKHRVKRNQQKQTIVFQDLCQAVGYNLGSGSLSVFIVAFIYAMIVAITNRSDLHVISHDIPSISFDFRSLEPDGTPITYRYTVRIPGFQYVRHVDDDDIFDLIRNLFGRVHQNVATVLGVSDDQYYHVRGTQVSPRTLEEIRIGLTGIASRPRVGQDENSLAEHGPAGAGLDLPFVFHHFVDGNNSFWEWIFKGDSCRAEFYASCRTNAIMMPDHTIDGRKLTGCFERALRCVCPWGSTYCHCQDYTDYPPVDIEELATACNGLPVLVICVSIYKKTTKKGKDFKMLCLNPEYYSCDEYKVIVINNPEWRQSSAHCCLFRPPIESQIESPDPEWKKFQERSFFNELLHKLCRSHDNICPICGTLYPAKEMKVHFRYHRPGISCLECGITFATQAELDVHCQYHCRHLGVGCQYVFSDEIKSFKEKKDHTMAVIYADLESAIEFDGTHTTILCGWVERDEMKVTISTKISDLLTYAAKRPEEQVLVYFHNGEGYDFHFVLLELAKMDPRFVKEIDVTADSSEKIRFFTVEFQPPRCEAKKIMFRDSFAFVQQSLSNWLESSKKSGADLRCFEATFPGHQEQAFVNQKNPFPYNAIKSSADLERDITDLEGWFVAEDAVELFCDRFSREELRQMLYEWFYPAKMVFKWKTVMDYYKTYLRCDVSQLCDVMEHFALQVKEEFDLNIHNYYGTPSLTWAAWLRQNTYELDTIPEEDFDVIISSIRGGQTGAMTRYYDCIGRDEDQQSFCCDLDCNSLYATVMLKFKFPCHDWRREAFDYVSTEGLLSFIKHLHENGRSGFIECDMEVIDHPQFYSYVPVASRRKITGVYNYQAMAEMAAGSGENFNHMVFSGLVNVVGYHEHYCCHTRLMEFYLEHMVVEVKRVYRIVHAIEEPVFHDYVNHNLEQRTKYSGDAIKKMLYKLMNNSLYGKTYEDITKRMNLNVVRTVKFDALEEQEIKRVILTTGNWTIYEAPQREFVMDKPIYLGAAITEYSKLWMYKFFYDDIRPKFPQAEVMYTDTDALTIKFPPVDGRPSVRSFLDLAECLNSDERQIIDTSNWSNCHELEEKHRKHNNEPGLFKSETGDGQILRMVALRAKTYIMECSNGETKMSVKGCPMKEKSKLTLRDFYEILMGSGETKVIEYDAITSKYHIVKSTKMTRVVLSGDDRKRYICDDRIHTYPLFSVHHKAALGRILFPVSSLEEWRSEDDGFSY